MFILHHVDSMNISKYKPSYTAAILISCFKSLFGFLLIFRARGSITCQGTFNFHHAPLTLPALTTALVLHICHPLSCYKSFVHAVPSAWNVPSSDSLQICLCHNLKETFLDLPEWVEQLSVFPFIVPCASPSKPLPRLLSYI